MLHRNAEEMVEYYTLSPSETINVLKSSESGLSKAEADKRLREYGLNTLPRDKRFTVLKMFFGGFKEPLILLLVFAGMLSLALQETVESIAIFSIVLLNTTLGFIQEYRAEKTIESLEKISAPIAKVMRDGKEQRIPAKDIVPGDIILLEAGDIVSADSRLIEISSLQIDEASLTGESVPSKKILERYNSDTPISDQENMAFRGTVITYGKGKAIVTSTGLNTEFGKIASALKKTAAVQTPLQRKFSQLAKQIGIICVILVLIVVATGILRQMPFAKLILFALVLAVSTIPSSLPLVVTIGLSMGTKELAKKNMLVKKLAAAEGLGSATIICSDKTGTITKNQMTVTDMYYDNQLIEVTGAGYDTNGEFLVKNKKIDPSRLGLPLRIGYLCNNAKLTEKHEIIGDPTEGSLIVLGKKGQVNPETHDLEDELPFDSERKRMSVILKNKKTKKIEAYVKGAPDIMLDICDRIFEKGKVRKLTKKDRQSILKVNNMYAKQALRVIGLAYKEVKDTRYTIESVEKKLIFVGLVGMMDPPREGVKEAVARCREAGIEVMIITGDQAITTKAVASDIGLYQEGDMVLTGAEIDAMDDSELEKIIDNIRIIARAMPIQKLRVVGALQKKGHIVAMTGDGVNDAPALKKANIGISMGITGTDVAKEVSATTLLDDNFATIVNAIEIGRNIYDKLIKSAKFFLSCNFGEISSVLIAILLGFPLPLLPLQLLLMNMLTDSFPAIGLGFEKSETGIMKRKPRNPKQRPLTNTTLISILIFGIIMGAGTLFLFMGYKNNDLRLAQTVAFTTLVMFQMFAVMSSRTLYPSIRSLNPFSNKWLLRAIFMSVSIQIAVIYWHPLQTIFGTTALQAIDWLKILGISSLGFVMMEASKYLMAKPAMTKVAVSASED